MSSGYCGKFFYCTLMLSVIVARPQVSVKTTLGVRHGTQLIVDFPNIGWYVFVSALATVLALLPTTKIPLACAGRQFRRRYYIYLVLPWVMTCCVKFADNLITQISALSHSLGSNYAQDIAIGIVIYCIIFGLAVEVMLHWYVLYQLQKDGIYTIVTTKLEDQ
ncbi:uncharacterized protein LOC115628383 [Scaptodrosophila lebanonensis]|uniref:Uncharacterized protein LOC115628383 n=1 Tax=Drosophila lebanonensis TaxID=7225 RepID=A0A6J2TZS3_DROLE|nr:uncharacterized protein LOC115628383 [Scaptodrosophila lebanonensis]